MAGAAPVRPLVEADRDDVARMWASLHRLHGSSGFAVGSARRLGTEIHCWIDLLVAGGDHFGFVAEAGGARAGFVAASVQVHPWLRPEQSGTIGAIWVEPAARRARVGRLLAAAALAELAARDVDIATVNAIVTVPSAHAFWRALGFSESAVQLRRETGTLSE